MNNEFADTYAHLCQQFTAQLAQRLERIRSRLQQIDPLVSAPSQLEALHREVHALVGSAGTFGMSAVSEAARALAISLQSFAERGVARGHERWEQVLACMDKLEEVGRLQLAGNAPSLQIQPEVPPMAEGRLVYLVEDDAEQGELLAQGLAQDGYKVRHFTTLSEFRAACTADTHECPIAVVMDMVFPEGDTAGAEIMAELKGRVQKLPPLVFVSVRDDLTARLAAYRSGACSYLTKPVDSARLSRLLDDIGGRMPARPYRVLLVDDDSEQLEVHASMLRDAGLQVRTVTHPMQTLEQVQKFRPDVLVLDVYMPDVSGPELAAVLREKEELFNLPILFLSAEQDISKQLLALNLGGDDFLVKPVRQDYFVAAVRSRARRGRHSEDILRQLRFTLYEREREHQALNRHALVSVTDARGAITYVNDSFCQVSGYTHRELLGQNHRLLKSGIHPPEFYQDMWRTLAAGQIWQGEVCNRRKDGSLYWVQASITPFLDTNGKPYQYVSIRTDITALKESQRAMQQNAERLRRGQAYANIGTWDWNIQTGELYWTEQIAPLFGYPAGELETSYDNFLNAVHPDDRQRVIDAVNACVERDVPYEIEHRVVWPDGTVRWLLEKGAVQRDASGKALQMLGVVQDIDERKRTELALAESSARLEYTQALARLGYWTVDLRTGEALWSKELYTLFGRDPETYRPTLNSYYQDVVHPEDVQALRQAEQETYASGKRNKLDHRIVLPDGSVRWVHIEGETECDANGQPVRLNGSIQDITERKQAELGLLEREQQLREAQSLAHIGNWQADMVTGQLTWSDEIYRIFGLEPGSCKPSVEGFKSRVHPDDLAHVEESEQRAERTGFHDVVHRIVRPDGTVRHVHELAHAERDENGKLLRLRGTVQDVTERVNAELRLHETEQRFIFAVEGAGDGIWDWDMASGAMLLSGNYEGMLGFSKGELAPTIDAWVGSVHPDDLSRVQHNLQMYLEGKLDTYEVELRLYCKDGGYKWVLCRGTVVGRDAQGKPLRMIGIHSDIQQRKEAENRVMLFAHVFNASEHAIGVTDGDGKLLYINPAHERLHGYTQAEVMGKPFTLFVTEEGMKAGPDMMAALVKGDGWTGLMEQRRKDGSTFAAFCSVGAIFDANGKMQYLFNIMYDYTDELNRQQELRTARDQAERANQAKSDFLSSMSHELRTPMNAILGFAQLLEYDDTLGADQRDSVHEIIKAGGHLLELINEVLDLAKIESGRIDMSLEPVELVGVMEECGALIQPLAATREIKCEIGSAGGVSVRADRTRLKQVLLNLLSNAVKYNHSAGSVRLEAQPADDGYLRISVIDTGPGISEQDMAGLFQPFNRLSAEQSQVEGTGIGLTITRRLIEMMGGRIGVSSQLGKGSTFWIELPQEDATTVGQAGGEHGSAAILQQAERLRQVLCIDDNPVNLKLIAQLLGMRKHIKLLTAHTPQLGIELALAHRPDLILLDINMPGLDGYQVLQILKAERSLQGVPVVAVTANAMPRDIERGREAGFTEYLTKPLEVKQFLNVVDNCLRAEE